MKKNPNMIFYIFLWSLLSLVLVHSVNPTEIIEKKKVEKISTSMYLNLPLDDIILPNIYNQRRLFRWETPQHFLDSFSTAVKVKFIVGKLANQQADFSGNINQKEKILVIGGGLAYDDDVDKTEQFFLFRNGRVKYYPFNAYLVDLDGFHINSGDENKILSYSDLAIDIKKPITMGEKNSLSTFIKQPFDTIILEYIPIWLISNVDVLKNLSQILKPGGKIIFNSFIALKVISKEKNIKKLQDTTRYNKKQIENIGSFYYEKCVKDVLKGFNLYCLKEDEKNLKQNMKKVFKIFKEEIDKNIKKTIDFDSSDFEPSTEYWYSDYCNSGYCFIYKKKEK